MRALSLLFFIILIVNPLGLLAENLDDNSVIVELGRKLYFDTRLSLDKDISCNSCHDLKNYGVDSLPTSPGHKGQLGDRNSPTVYNAALHISQFWDGRAKDVEEQALGPVLNPVEMAMPAEDLVIERLGSDKEYPELFKKAFPKDEKPLNFINMGKAIGAFERTLITTSRFDKWEAGDKSALTAEEIAGFEKFKQTGCTICHGGKLFGGNMYQKLGLVKAFKTEDTGRHKQTGNEADKYFFKVPSLLNIAKTGPYFHDGSVKTLNEAVKIMGEYQLGKNLSDEDVKSIVIFLNSLTGDLPKEYAK
ncbi:MAG: cytochrome-c peroxidase [Bdellovibrionota bacterium]